MRRGRNVRGVGMTSVRTRDRLVNRLRGEGIANEAVLDRIREVPRHLFVDEALASRAYEDTALPIGLGQTISQPYIVALMTEALVRGLAPGEKLGRVLEIGTGSGYQTAVAAPFARHIFSMERLLSLIRRAQERLRELEIANVSLRHGDGLRGWKAEAPFQGIIVAAAPADVPGELLEQLAEGGRMVIPVGARGGQRLQCITRTADGYRHEPLGAVSFVPLLPGTGN